MLFSVLSSVMEQDNCGKLMFLIILSAPKARRIDHRCNNPVPDDFGSKINSLDKHGL